MIVESYGLDAYNQEITSELSHTLRMPTGGDNTAKVIVLESNQNHAAVRDTEVCTTLPAAMGEGGGYVPMVCLALDNHPNDSRVTIREDNIVQSLTSRCGTGGNNVPMVLINNDKENDYVKDLQSHSGQTS